MPDSNKFKIETRDDVESLLLLLGCKPIKVCHSHDNERGEWEDTNEWGVGCIVHYICDKRRKTGTSFASEILTKLDDYNIIQEVSLWGIDGLLAITYRRKHCRRMAA